MQIYRLYKAGGGALAVKIRRLADKEKMGKLADSFIIIGHKSLISSSVVLDSYQVLRAAEAWP